MPLRLSDSRPKLRREPDRDMEALELSLAMLRHAVADYASRFRSRPGRPTDLVHSESSPNDVIGAHSVDRSIVAASGTRAGFGSRVVGRLRIIATSLFGMGRQRH
jgi:hypothetical protein